MKYGIAFTQQVMPRFLVSETTVMQFGFEDKHKAQRVMDLSAKNIDPILEALSIFEYPEERESELEISELLPWDIPTIPINLNNNRCLYEN